MLRQILPLLATCLLFREGFSYFTKQRVVTCDTVGNVHRLSCDKGVIIVNKAFYGREDQLTCSNGRLSDQLPRTQCSQSGTLQFVKTRCDGKKVCELNTDLFHTSDPCVGIYKYLDTSFSCIPAVHRVTCENSLAYLQCDERAYIHVYAADYGRRDRFTCTYQLPTDKLQTTDCWRPTSQVAQSCDGKTSCVVAASNAVFGDPCPGTYKYLEVAYRCQRASVTCEGQTTRLVCGPGKAITVHSAVYGRQNTKTCSSGRPWSQVTNVKCASSSTKVAQICNGRQSCSFTANNAMFGDPCRGTYKYLTVVYSCD